MAEQEHALIIARVSSGKQREEDQRPRLIKFAGERGYVIDHVEEIHGKSAFRGKHLKQLHKAIEDYVEHGEASVVIFRDVDRSSREGAQATYDLRGKIIRAGGRMEFAGQEYLNDQRNQDMLLGILATSAREESETKSRRKLQGIEVRQARGEVNGRPVWGYKLDYVNGLQVLVPTDLGRKWIPRIFQEVADGKSLRSVQAMLTGVPSPQGNGTWSEDTLRALISRPTYHGGRAGKGNMEYEPLVSVELWQQANAAVAARVRRGRSTTKREPALLKPICGNCYGVEREGAPGGKSPMYRKTRFGHDYYVCSGTGPGRRSCGTKAIPCDMLDAAVDRIMSHRTEPHYETAWIEGDTRAEQLANINEKISAAAKAQRYDLIPALSAQATEITSQPMRKGRMVKRDSGKTVGEHWQTLDTVGKREELAKWECIVYPNGRVRLASPWQKEPDDEVRQAVEESTGMTVDELRQTMTLDEARQMMKRKQG